MVVFIESRFSSCSRRGAISAGPADDGAHVDDGARSVATS